MMANPRVGQLVRVHYRKRFAAAMPWHGAVGVVEIVSRGPGPRNHGVRINGRLTAIPCGNLFKIGGAP